MRALECDTVVAGAGMRDNVGGRMSATAPVLRLAGVSVRTDLPLDNGM